MLPTINSAAGFLMRNLRDSSRLGIPLVHTARSLSTGKHQDTQPKERKISVEGIDINCLEVGNGVHTVLLLPGAVGTMWTDFKPQIEKLNREKLRIVVWDPPGYGKSRPPNRTYPDDFFQRDAVWAHGLMKALGYGTFSLLGWSDGGITSMFMAALYPNSIRKMIITGANAYILPEELKIYQSIRNIDTWSERMRFPMIATYGEGYFRSTWVSWVDAMTGIFDRQKGDICKDLLPKIQCPTLIVHGSKDIMVHKDHPEYLHSRIANSRIQYFEKGGHNLHLRFPEEFNQLATDFLLEK